MIIFCLMLPPVVAWAAALATASERAAAAGDYAVGTGLDDRFGRLAASGDYLPGGDTSTSTGLTGTTSGGTVNWILRRHRQQ